MSQFVIFTDSGCDLSEEVLQSWGINCQYLTFRFNDAETEYAGNAMPDHEFYDKMRAGGIAKTAAVNVDQFANTFKPALDEGKDVLYIGLSSGISNTYNAGRLAAQQLREEYPDRKVVAFDSLTASAGHGLVLYLAAQKRDEGSSLEETVAYLEEIRPSVAAWFTVEDLVYLKRGGRVSATTALVGNALGIKPVMHVDDEGKLIKVTTAHGRRKSLAMLAAKYKETAKTPGEGPVFISHGDCREDAEILAKMLGTEVQLITYVSPVIGAHSGPGTVALFFIAKER
jgi:DegV family protein with EDD domain